MTQERLAAAVGIAVETVSRLETGRVGVGLETLMVVSDVFGIRLGELVDVGAEEPDVAADSGSRELLAVWDDLNSEVRSLLLRIARELGAFQRRSSSHAAVLAAEGESPFGRSDERE